MKPLTGLSLTYPGGTSLQRAHRKILREAMETEGFTVYPEEWWHFDFNGWREYPIQNIPFERQSKQLNLYDCIVYEIKDSNTYSGAPFSRHGAPLLAGPLRMSSSKNWMSISTGESSTRMSKGKNHGQETSQVFRLMKNRLIPGERNFGI